ncbi:MAG: hypothetical protein K6T55_00245 [Syntrophobacterales bacterium]|nr:hypothetical protein [Syntrophobacterales bacterium]
MVKFASLKYDFCGNLGDEIQSVAAEQFLPRVDKKFDRDSLRQVSEPDRYLLILNGYFSRFPERSFPPPPASFRCFSASISGPIHRISSIF